MERKCSKEGDVVEGYQRRSGRLRHRPSTDLSPDFDSKSSNMFLSVMKQGHGVVAKWNMAPIPWRPTPPSKARVDTPSESDDGSKREGTLGGWVGCRQSAGGG